MSDVKTLNSIQMKHFQQLYVKANFKKITGGGVKCLLFHTVPPPTKNRLKICLSPFHEALDNFSFVKFPVPGNTTGTRSWNTSRNALLGDFQERTPGQGFGTNHGTLLKCQVLRLWILYKSNILCYFMWKQTLKKSMGAVWNVPAF